MQANLDALERWRIVPRMLRDVSERDLSTRGARHRDAARRCCSRPVGVQSIVHAEAELRLARAAAAVGLPFILSTAASHSIEQVAEAMGDAKRWYQLYWPRERELAASFVARAEAAGYAAIVLTLDTLVSRLAPARPRQRLPAVPQGRGRRQLLLRSGVPCRA